LPKEAIPHLENALAAGIPEAPYTLGLTYLSAGEKQKALDSLELYQRNNPDNKSIEMLLDGIRSGKVEIGQADRKAPGLGEADFGIYAIVDIKNQVTKMHFRISQRDSEWVLERRRPNNSWDTMECPAECRLITSTEADVQRFFSASVLSQILPTCIHNRALAFCRYSQSNDPRKMDYTFVVITEKQAIPVRLRKIQSAQPRNTLSAQHVYNIRCAACHSIGLSGAPRIDKQADWTVRRKKSLDAIYKNTLTGVTLHAARDGLDDITDEEVRSAVDLMLEMVSKTVNR